MSEKDFDVTPLTNFLTSQLKNKKRRRKRRKHELKKTNNNNKKPKSNNLMRTQKMKQRHCEMPDGFKPKILPCLRAQQKTEDSILKIGRIKATTNKYNCQIIAVSPSSTLDWRIFSQTAQSTTFSWGFFVLF